MQHLRSLVVLLALGTAVAADEKPKGNARNAVEGYLAAALAGKVEAAAALAVDGQSPARKKRIEELKDLLNVRMLRITRVLVGEKRRQAIAVSEPVKLTRANPDGRDTGCLVFALVQVANQWRIKDIDFRTSENAREKVKEFERKHPDAKEIPARKETR